MSGLDDDRHCFGAKGRKRKPDLEDLKGRVVRAKLVLMEKSLEISGKANMPLRRPMRFITV